MIERVKKLTVKYNGRIVGYLAELENAAIAFQYDDEWIKTGFTISPFSLPLKKEVFINKKITFGGLYGVFHDSLPDGWGELLFVKMLAQKGINPDKLSPLTRLSLISGNGLGALAYEPSQSEKAKDAGFDLDDIAGEVKRILGDESANADLDKIYQLGGSSGGARPKVHIKDEDEYWIVKFPTHLDPEDIGEKEFNANIAAKRCGININEFKLFPSKLCKGYFGAKRFDRIGERRVHIISLSHLLETTHRIPNLDYVNLFQVIKKICVDQKDMYEAFNRMCFNVLYGHRDDHGKNFAFIYDERLKGYTLSPAYDLTKTVNKPEHEMTVNGAGKPTEKDLLEVADIMKLSPAICKESIAKIKAEI
jgi:serine/threonine-protein kinase HipA